MGLLRLMIRSFFAALLGGLLAGTLSSAVSAKPVEMALQRSPRESRIVLDLSQRRISLVRGDQRLGSWPVAIGDRYMAFHRNGRGEFGIHGTAWPHWVQIRAAVSLGCVRMLNSHIRQLFDAVDVGTRLEIRS